MNIDAHQHFWRYNEEEFGWINDAMSVIRRDFLPKHLSNEIEKAGIDGVISVQARQSLEETQWLLQLAGENDFIKGVVGWVDLGSEKIAEQLEEFSKNPKLVGVRHVVQDEPDDRFMMGDDFRRGIKLLPDFDLTYDILIFEKHLSIACKFVDLFPSQRFVLDHMAKPLIREGKLEPWKTNIRRLAAYPNVYCKVSGMVTEADWNQWKTEDFLPYLDVVFEAFGPERIMFGSDWPVCTLAATYQQVMEIISKYIRQFSAEEQAAILGKNAQRFYKLKNA